MKIGISCHPTVGGSGIVATELARALADGGDEVHVLSYALPARWSSGGSRLFFHPVTVGQYPLFEYPPYSLALATKMVDVVRQHHLDLLHVHYAIPNAISAILAREILLPDPIKVITTLHGTDVTLVGNDPSYLETTRLAIRRSDCVTAVSESLREATFDQLGNEREIRVVPNFIDPERYLAVAGELGARTWAKDGERVLMHVSNFRRVKRVTDVIEIFERVSRDHRVRLLLVGEGPELPRIEQYCREAGLADQVNFLGTVRDVEAVLVGADVFLLPSETESFGLAALEALSCEVPVVASLVGGVPEVVENGVSGFLRPVGDVAGMAEAVDRLLCNEEERLEMGKNGRLQTLERYSQERVVGCYRELYEEVLREKPTVNRGMAAGV